MMEAAGDCLLADQTKKRPGLGRFLVVLNLVGFGRLVLADDLFGNIARNLSDSCFIYCNSI